MSSPKLYSHAWIQGRVERWKKSLTRRKPSIVIEYGDGPFSRFSSTRLRFQYAVDSLDEELLRHLRANLREFADEVHRRGMPAKRASQDYDFRSQQEAQFYIDTFKRAISELQSMEDEFGERERPFSESDFERFAENFERRVGETLGDCLIALNTAIYPSPGTVRTEAERDRISRQPAQSPPKRISDSIATERRDLYAKFVSKARQLGIKVTEGMVAKAARPNRWHDRTPVVRWKSNDPRCTRQEDNAIRALLRRNPLDVWPSRRNTA